MSALAPIANAEANLNALADVAATLFISLPDSPQGKPFIDRADANNPAALLRAMRKRLNLTQREFGVLLAPPGGSPISPSVICQLESALQSVPPPLVSRAVAATTACQKLGEYLAGLPGSKALDAAGGLKSLGPGCIDQLQPYLDAHPDLPAEEQHVVREFLSTVTKRRHSTGGSRPGARGPYRKLAKVSAKSFPPAGAAAGAAAAGTDTDSAATSSISPSDVAASDASLHALPLASACVDVADAPSAAAACGCSSGNSASRSSTPCSTPGHTPGSSRGSSRPRSPNGEVTGYESESKSPRVCRSASGASIGSDMSGYASSPAFTPGGTVVGLGTPTPSSLSSTPGSTAGASLISANGEASLEVLLALRRLQEQNEALQRENERLRAGTGAATGAGAGAVPPTPPAGMGVEMARSDFGMSC